MRGQVWIVILSGRTGHLPEVRILMRFLNCAVVFKNRYVRPKVRSPLTLQLLIENKALYRK